MKLEIYPRHDSKKRLAWYWRIKSKGRIIAQGEGYQRRAKVVKMLRNFLKQSTRIKLAEQLIDLGAEP